MKKITKLFLVTFVVTVFVVLFLDTAYTQYNAVNSSNAPFVSDFNQQQSAKSIMQNSGRDIIFIENLGQIRDTKRNKRPEILFLVRSQGVDMYITKSGISYVFRKTEGSVMNLNKTGNTKSRYHRLDMEFVGMNKSFRIQKEFAVEQKYNYYTPEYPNGIFPKGYKKITLENIYEGIDLVYYERENKMKYDFIVRAGANPDDIKMKYKGAGTIYLDLDGSVIVTTPLGEIREERPFTYSKNSGRKIESGYSIKDDVLLFNIAEYENNEEIIIDPYLLWATYYGGDGTEEGLSICTDEDRNLYITGGTTSIAIPNEEDELEEAYNQDELKYYKDRISLFHIDIERSIDAFILKFDRNGILLWATYYGGRSIDFGTGICSDNSGNVFVTGFTMSAQADWWDELPEELIFPRWELEGASNQVYFGGGCYDAFILKFRSSGERLWATFYGGDGGSDTKRGSIGKSICTDNMGNLYVAGSTYDTNLEIVQPNANAYRQLLNREDNSDNMDAFILKFNSNCELIWSTYFGGSDYDNVGSPYCEVECSWNFEDNIEAIINCKSIEYWGGNGICTDNLGNLYVTGYTNSENFIPDGFENVGDSYNNTSFNGGEKDAFVLKFNSSCELVWATYFGGSNAEVGYGIYSDNIDNLYVTGSTNSDNFIPEDFEYKGGAFSQNEIIGGHDAFILKFNSISCELEWATYYGGSGDDYGKGICTDDLGNVYVTGSTKSSDFEIQKRIIGLKIPAPMSSLTPRGSLTIRSENFLLGPKIPWYIIAEDPFSYTEPFFEDGNISDIFILMFNSKGRRVWATCYGHSGKDYGLNICTDNFRIYVAGVTESDDFPLKELDIEGAFNAVNYNTGEVYVDIWNNRHEGDVFLLKFDKYSSSYRYLWYLVNEYIKRIGRYVGYIDVSKILLKK